MKSFLLRITIYVLGLFLVGEGNSIKTKQCLAGDTIKLRCRAQVTADTQGLKWIIPESASSKERLEVTHDSLETVDNVLYYVKAIKVVNATAVDTGYFTCMYQQLNNQYSNSSSKTRNEVSSYSRKRIWIKRIYIYVYDASNLLLATSSSVEVEYSGDIILPCRSSHQDANVSLKRVATSRQPHADRVSYDRSIGFVIKNATDYDNSLWKCEARLYDVTEPRDPILYGMSQKKIMVLVSSNINPNIGKVVVIARKSRVLKNDSIEITCEVPISIGGRVNFVWNTPRSVVKKLKFGYEASLDKTYLSNLPCDSVIGWSRLIVPNADVLDSGNYFCSIVTSQQNKSGNVHVTVFDSPFINITSGDSHVGEGITSVVGESADLSFIVDAFPDPQFLWLNGTVPLEETMNTLGKVERRVKIKGSSFLIRSLSVYDVANYTLQVQTPFAVINKTIQLEVIEPEPAEIVTPFEKISRAYSGEDFTIFCVSRGAPLPSLRWFRDGIQLPESSDVLTLQRLKLIDEGNYTCEVRNKYGSKRTSTILQVKDSKLNAKVAIVSFTTLAILAVVSTAGLLIFKSQKVERLKKQLKLEQQYLVPIINREEMPLEEQTQCLSYDPKKWEFPRDRLRLGKTLGRGAFGRVVQATAFDMEKTSSCKTIAVKMLKIGSRSTEYQALMSELKILIHLGRHLNIVNLLGACTTKEGPLMILVEYCRHGNLSVYLRKHRDRYVGCQSTDGENSKEKKTNPSSEDSTDDSAFSSLEGDGEYKSLAERKRGSRTSSTSGAGTIASNEGEPTEENHFLREYEDSPMGSRKNSNVNDDEQKDKKCKKKTLNLADLVSYSLQVSRGMEFLASKKCIHRDLAARNILLSDYQVVKICDFGLARDVYKDPDYIQTGETRLPLKWMAPEAIFDKVYTTKSDVWSFGVLLWEIFTLGGSPYPGLQIDEDFCNKLRRGVRMEKPTYANNSIYSAMLACWANSPEERPTFTKLCEELSDVLQAEAGHEYLDIMKIFESSLEGKLPLRGVTPGQCPEETFGAAENLSTRIDRSSVDYVTVIEVETHSEGAKTTIKVEEESICENQSNFDSTVDVTQETIVLDSLILEEGYNSVDSEGCSTSNRNNLHTSLEGLQNIDNPSSYEAPPLYDDVITSRTHDSV